MPPKVSSSLPLIFDWTPARGRFGRLMLALLIVIVGIAAFFYVFRVVYPQSERFTPVPHQVVMFDAGNPATTAIMNRVRDVDYLLLPTRNHQDNSPSLQRLAPVFRPSFEGHQLVLQDLPHRPFTAPPPRLIDVDAPVLPPLDLSELKELPPQISSSGKAKTRTPRLRMKFHGLAEARLPRTLPDLSEVPLTDPSTCRFKIAVAPDGRITFALPLTNPDQAAAASLLTERVRRLRFAALPQTPEATTQHTSSATQWGEISFEWSDAP
ncbi:hypothetical protein FEM03_04615 [Phragmitibacter flavus]|uniref:Uncharacterized protein n=1 Tax=Phragmitibacter flavus TaxID=2576071 RepID=A0A5R8KIA2_9BACT|nr:hypothetical protein [Phragmitibacter flavus]TLD72012.1 hypothetical protein FEM03_04615 [Phragmitibacter flavus]